jgi:uncharacterized protein YuzE
MKARYDPKVDALYVDLSDRPAVDSQEIAPDIILDFDADNRIVGIEVLNASTRMAIDALPVAAE